MILPCGCEADDAGNVVKPCHGQEKPVAVARAACGCCVAVMVVPGPESSIDEFSDHAKELRRWAKLGLVREAQTVGWVRHTAPEDGGLGGCRHRGKRARR